MGAKREIREAIEKFLQHPSLPKFRGVSRAIQYNSEEDDRPCHTLDLIGEPCYSDGHGPNNVCKKYCPLYNQELYDNRDYDGGSGDTCDTLSLCDRDSAFKKYWEDYKGLIIIQLAQFLEVIKSGHKWK
jgi:hypothetical protein